MLRRTQLVLAFVILTLLCPAISQNTSGKKIALTFDDLPLAVPGDDHAPGNLPDVQRVNAEILKTLAAHHAPAIGFVNENKLNVTGERDARVSALREWLKAGMELGNHTYSHHALSEVENAAYEDDFVRGSTITAAEMKAAGKTEKYFRYPFLDTGKDQSQKDAIISFYANRAYVNAPVTAQNEDWLFNAPYAEAVVKHDAVEQKHIAEAYLQHTEDQLAYSERLSKDLFGREIPQVMLLHVDQLNADQLDAVLSLMEKRGYKFVTLDQALQDPAYSTPDNYVGPEGLIWLERWQISLSHPIHPWEPPTPKWAQDAYERLTGHKP